MNCECRPPMNVFNGVCGLCLSPLQGAEFSEDGTLLPDMSKLRFTYEHACKSCYGVGEAGYVTGDGSYENRTCECIRQIEERVWQEAVAHLDELEAHSTAKILNDEGKRKGYII